MNFYIDEISCLENVPNEVDSVLIYCHGILENKYTVQPYLKDLLNNNIAVISFDFPCHGDSKVNDNKFTLTESIKYLNRVTEYCKKRFKNKKIFLLAASFGGYVSLNKIKIKNDYDKVLLLYPAVNFLEALVNKLNINDSYFDNFEFIGPILNLKIYKDAYFEFKKNNLMINFNNINNVYILHGEDDQTIPIDKINEFRNKYNISLKTIKKAHHGLIGFENEVIRFIFDIIKK